MNPAYSNNAQPRPFVAAALAVLCLWLHGAAYAGSIPLEGRHLKEVCSSLKRMPGKPADAYLVDPGGRIIKGPIELGTISLTDLSPDNDYFPIPTRYRVVISSPDYLDESRLELRAAKLKRPTCPGTSEFSLTFQIDAFRSTPGDIGKGVDVDPDRFFYDAKAYYPVPPAYKFDFKVAGVLLTPEPQLVETDSSKHEIDEFFLGSSRVLTLKLKNIGNMPLDIRDLVDLAALMARKADHEKIRAARDDCASRYSFESGGICTLQIQKRRDDCVGRSIPPGATCSMELERVSEAPLPAGAVYILKIESNYRLGYDHRIEFKLDARASVHGGLKLR